LTADLFSERERKGLRLGRRAEEEACGEGLQDCAGKEALAEEVRGGQEGGGSDKQKRRFVI
jgi:hypothetical protein